MLIGSYGPEVQKQLKVSYPKNCNNFMLKLNSNESLSQQIERFWEIDTYGTKNSAEQNLLPSSEDKTLHILEKGSIFNRCHFEVPLLWKEKIPVLPNNREMALKHFYSLEKKFAKISGSKTLYQKQIHEYIENGHAKKLDKNEMFETSNITNYLTHHGVFNVNTLISQESRWH